MTLTQGELICIFDCDHVATRAFLQATVGGFLTDPKLALIQTPHYFYSPDPFERNLSVARHIPGENDLFYGPIQQGNDNWDATSFSGSCAVIRRRALEDIGGFAVETVTEDAHTSLKLQRRGWHAAFLAIPLAAGLATERLALHIIQRTRWARGITQIFRLDNPLLGRGLKWQQRICYFNSMLYFQYGLPRLVFVTAPLAYLLFNQNIIASSASMIFAYVLPHLILAVYASSRINGRHRYSFWGEIYDTVIMFHIIIPTLATLFSPKRGKFNVTDKGRLLEEGYFDFNIVRPHLIVLILLVLGIIWGSVRTLMDHYVGMNPQVILLNVFWAGFNVLILLAAIAVARETRQVRQTIRIDVNIPAIVHFASGISLRTRTLNLSMGGVRLVTPDERYKTDTIEEVELLLQSGAVCIPVHVVDATDENLQLKFEDMPLSKRRELVRVVLARADAWLDPPYPQDNPLKSLLGIIRCVLELLWYAIRGGKRRQTPAREADKADTQGDAV